MKDLHYQQPPPAETPSTVRVDVTLIAAMSRNRLIGSGGGGLPWRLPRDIAHFRNYTDGKWVLVGRVTYEEMKDWFGSRNPLILTRQADYRPFESNHRVVRSVGEAVDIASGNGAKELVVLGGGSTFEDTLRIADRLVLTRIDTVIALEDPVFFPDYEGDESWKLAYQECWPPDEENAYGMRLEILER